MNQKSGQNSLGLDICFEDEANPIVLFKKWFAVAEKSEVNDPNALSLATSSSDGISSVRMILLKGLSDKGFVFYTNFELPGLLRFISFCMSFSDKTTFGGQPSTIQPIAGP